MPTPPAFRARTAAPTQALPPTTVSGADLVRQVGSGFQFVSARIEPQQAVAAGNLQWRELRPGLTVHSAESSDLHDMRTQVPERPGLRVLLLLEGRIEVAIGPQRLNLAASVSGRPAAVGALIGLTRPELFQRFWRRGTYARKVVVTLEPSWFAACGLVQDGGGSAAQAFLGRHLAIERWQPSPRAVALAEQILRGPQEPPLLAQLYLESRAIELASEALASLEHAGTEHAALRPHEYQRVRAVRDLLDRDASDDLSLAALAQAAHINANTLQQQFRTAFGLTIFEYLRESRLQRARAALEQRGLSVAETATLAGYTSAANFATAYKRRFGLSPKQARVRV